MGNRSRYHPPEDHPMGHHEWDHHHLFPRSSFPRLAREHWNLRATKKKFHQAWHLLVGNASPLAGLIHLFHEFTPGNMALLRHDPALPEFIELLERLKKETGGEHEPSL